MMKQICLLTMVVLVGSFFFCNFSPQGEGTKSDAAEVFQTMLDIFTDYTDQGLDVLDEYTGIDIEEVQHSVATAETFAKALMGLTGEETREVIGKNSQTVTVTLKEELDELEGIMQKNLDNNAPDLEELLAIPGIEPDQSAYSIFVDGDELIMANTVDGALEIEMMKAQRGILLNV